jgi:hypothetical protein
MEYLKNLKNAVLNYPEYPIIIFLATFSIFLHLFFANNLEFHRDELLYFSLGQHPAFGYATVPPMIGWIAWLMKSLFGYTLFAVRIFPALMSGAIIFHASEIASELGGGKYARVLAALGMLIPVFALRSFSLFMPVFLDIFFWTLSIYLIIRYINSGSDKILLVFGAVAGLSFLNKYLIGILFIIILIIIPFTGHRRILSKKMFWNGIALGALVFLPNLIWQVVHGMPVFNHMSELASTQLVHVNLISFMVEQLLSPGAASVLTVAGLIYIHINKSIIKFRFLGLVVILIVVSLMLMHGKSYYTIGIFPFLIAAGSVAYEKLLKPWYLRMILPVLLIYLTVLILPFGIPVYNAEGLRNYFDEMEARNGLDVGRTFEDGSKHSLPQDYADMIGWNELVSVAYKAWQMIPDKSAAFIYCENYGQAGAITVIGKKYGLPQAVCFSESFRYWFPKRFEPDITSFVYINDELGDDVKMLFAKITEVGKITNPDAREFGTAVYLCQEPRDSFNKFWQERIRDEQ